MKKMYIYDATRSCSCSSSSSSCTSPLQIHLQRHLGRAVHHALLVRARVHFAGPALLVEELARLAHGHADEGVLAAAAAAAAAANGVGSKTKVQRGGKRPGATYARKQNLEELDVDEDADGSGGEDVENAGAAVAVRGKASEELRRMAAKFREVDDWGLDFEEVTGSSDRMRDAR
ncbi:MAG: hypothetical protein Q9177_001125 [Variospora cf. flavescens]